MSKKINEGLEIVLIASRSVKQSTRKSAFASNLAFLPHQP